MSKPDVGAAVEVLLRRIGRDAGLSGPVAKIAAKQVVDEMERETMSVDSAEVVLLKLDEWIAAHNARPIHVAGPVTEIP